MDNELHLFDVISYELTGELMEQMKSFDKGDFTMYLSSPGGAVDAGIDLFNAIKRYQGKVTIVVDAIAASMGSYLLQAADERVVSQNSKLMVHAPWGVAMGNASDMRAYAELLDGYAETMRPVYAEASGKSEEEIKAIMDAETWYFGGKKIVEAGFADRVATQDAKAFVNVDVLSKYCKSVPESIVKEEAERSAAMRSRSMTQAEARAIRDKHCV